MPKRIGLRDDDMLGRLADLERRMDAVEAEDDKKKPARVKDKE